MNGRVCIILAGACLRTLTVSAQTDRSIIFSAPKHDSVSTNLNQLSKKNLGSLSPMMEGQSVSGPGLFTLPETESPLPPLQRPSAGRVKLTKKDRERADREKNWALVAPEDQILGLTGEEMMGAPELGENGLEKKPTSSFEKFYQSMGRTPAGVTNRLSDSRAAQPEDDSKSSNKETEDRSSNPFEARLQETERAMQNLLKQGPETKPLPDFQLDTVKSDFAAAPFRTKTLEEKAQDLRLIQFRQMLQENYAKPAGLAGLPGESVAGGLVAPSSAFRPVTAPPANSSTYGRLAGPPAPLETKLPETAPLNPPPVPLRPIVGELPRRKF